MAIPASHKNVFCFGLFRAHAECGELFKQDRRVHLQDQPFRMLMLLLERPGEVVAREELRERLWPQNTFDNGLNVAVRKMRDALGDSAENPRFIETVPRRGYRFIAPVCIKAPVADAEPDAAEALSDISSAKSVLTSTAIARWRKYTFAATGLLALAVAVAVTVSRIPSWNSGRQTPPGPAKSTLAPRPIVAVMEFQNLSGRPSDEWISTAISEMLTTELGAGEQLHPIPVEDVIRMKRELRVTNSGSLARETAVRAGKNLNADLLVGGSFTVIGGGRKGRVRVDVRMQELSHGEIVAEVAETADEQHLYEIAERAGIRLREAMNVPAPSPVVQAAAHAALPSNPVASRLYAQGLARLRVVDAVGARDLFEHAVIAEPGFPLSHMALASTWRVLGYEQKAKAEANKALELSSRLPRADRLLIEGRYYQLSSDIPKAISAYHALFALFPDSLEDGLLLAESQTWGGKPADALVTVESLRRLPAPISQDPRIDIQQARALGGLGREGGLAYLRQAEEKARLQGAPLLAAKAQIGECISLNASAQFEDGAQACQAAYSAFVAAGNPADTAQSLRHLGDARQSQGRLDEALGLYEQALTINQSVGDNTGVAVSINQMAILYESRGDLTAAEKLYRHSYTLFLKVGHRLNAGVLAGNVGGVLLQRGKLREAEKTFAESMSLARESGSKGIETQAHNLLAELALARGDFEHARQHIESAQALEPQGDNVGRREALMRMSRILAAQDDLPGARRNRGEALVMAEKIGAKGLAAQARLALAELDLEDGRPARAEQPIRDALAVFRAEKMRDDEVNADILLSRSLLMQNKVSQAQSALSERGEGLAHSQNPANRLLFAIAEARVKVAAGAPGRSKREARSQLLKCITQAKNFGFIPLQYEARLALAEIGVKDNLSVGQNGLASLEQDARSRGLTLIARKAAGLRSLHS